MGVPDAASLPEDFKFWEDLDANRKAESPPAEGLLDQISKLNKRSVALTTAADEERESYKKQQIDGMKVAITGLDGVKKKFQSEIDRLPAEFKAELKKVTDGF